MRVLAICGSLRPDSYTRHALQVALSAAEAAGAETGWVSLDDLPWCDGRDGSYGERVDAFRAEIQHADALLIGSPEYYGSFTGILKNALDLLGPTDLRGKLIGLVAVAKGSAGAMNTLNHLRHVVRWGEAWVLPAQVSVPEVSQAFSRDGVISRPGLQVELEQLGQELVRYARLLSAG